MRLVQIAERILLTGLAAIIAVGMVTQSLLVV